MVGRLQKRDLVPIDVKKIVGVLVLPILMDQVSVTKIFDTGAPQIDEGGDRLCGDGGDAPKNGRRQLSELLKMSSEVRRSQVKDLFDQPDPLLLFFFSVVAGAAEDQPSHAMAE